MPSRNWLITGVPGHVKSSGKPGKLKGLRRVRAWRTIRGRASRVVVSPLHIAHTPPAYGLHAPMVFSGSGVAGGPGTVSAIDGHGRLPAPLKRGDQVMTFVRIIETLTSLGSGEGAFIRFRAAAMVTWAFGEISGMS